MCLQTVRSPSTSAVLTHKLSKPPYNKAEFKPLHLLQLCLPQPQPPKNIAHTPPSSLVYLHSLRSPATSEMLTHKPAKNALNQPSRVFRGIVFFISNTTARPFPSSAMSLIDTTLLHKHFNTGPWEPKSCHPRSTGRHSSVATVSRIHFSTIKTAQHLPPLSPKESNSSFSRQ